MLIITDDESGEVIREVAKKDFLDFKKNEVDEYLKDTTQVYMPSFSKIDLKLFTDVKVSNAQSLNYLISLLHSSDGILRYNHRKVNKKLITSHTSIYYKNVRKVIKELIEQDVIKEKIINRNTYYVFNPFLCSRGKRVDNELYDLFKESRWNRASNKRINIKYIEKEENDENGPA